MASSLFVATLGLLLVLGTRRGAPAHLVALAAVGIGAALALVAYAARQAARLARTYEAALDEARARAAALEEREERFRLLLENVPDEAIFFLDREGRVASWNAGAARVEGWRAFDVLGLPLGAFHLPEEAREGRPERALAAARERGFHHEEGWRVRRDGTRFWADVTLVALRDRAGNHRGFGAIVRDATARRSA